MKPAKELSFSVKDLNDSGEISPANVSLAMLGEFQKDVSDFLKGSKRDIDPEKVLVSIEEGSLRLTAAGLVTATSLWADLDTLNSPRSLASIDPQRAEVILQWQQAAQRSPTRSYLVSNEIVNISVNSESKFDKLDTIWVKVEKYLYGTIYDMGGDKKANIHIKLENGEKLKPIVSSQSMLENHSFLLYKKNMLHVEAEENLNTGELRNLRLISFVDYDPQYNENEHKDLVKKGTMAWGQIKDTNDWLEKLRGN